MIDAKLLARVERAILAGGGHSVVGVQTSVDDINNVAIFNTHGGQQLRITVPNDFSDSNFSTSVNQMIQENLHPSNPIIKVPLSTLVRFARQFELLSEELNKIIEEKQ